MMDGLVQPVRQKTASRPFLPEIITHTKTFTVVIFVFNFCGYIQRHIAIQMSLHIYFSKVAGNVFIGHSELKISNKLTKDSVSLVFFVLT